MERWIHLASIFLVGFQVQFYPAHGAAEERYGPGRLGMQGIVLLSTIVYGHHWSIVHDELVSRPDELREVHLVHELLGLLGRFTGQDLDLTTDIQPGLSYHVTAFLGSGIGIFQQLHSHG